MKDRGGFALVVTLALVVLVSFAVIAYFSRTVTNRRIESATSSAIRADTLARAASEIIVGDLRTEIIGGSTVTQPTGQMPIYSPSDPAKMVPSRSLANAGLLTNSNFVNLVKQSADRFYPTTGYNGTPIIIGSSGIGTAIVSANNKLVTQARWNIPVLNTGAGFDSDDKLPKWILIDRQGVAPSQSTWSDTFRDYTPGNDSAIVGRFAFNLYDTGGLLDASMAGNPIYAPAFTNLQIQQLKSTQTGASLDSIIPGFDAAKQTTFVNTWRFNAEISSSFFGNFMNISPTFAETGFMRPTIRNGSSNSIPFSRQDLLRATIASNAYIPAVSLPYFTHFSRELNAPSWTPGTPAGSTIDYAALAEQAIAINRDIPNVRVKASFIRTDGTTALAGEPLIKNRFPLRRLDAIGSTGFNPSAFPVMVAGVLQVPTATTTSTYASGTTVQRDFGLSGMTQAGVIAGTMSAPPVQLFKIPLPHSIKWPPPIENLTSSRYSRLLF